MPYWTKKHGLTDSNINNHINWTALKRAMKRIPMGQRRWLIKHATGHCGVGRMLLRRKHQQHSKCPRCDQINETTLHILTCQDSRAIAQWNASISKLSTWLTKSHTHPFLHDRIIQFLQRWHDTGTASAPASLSPQINQAFHEQADIGGYNFLLGRVSNKFSTIQDAYLKSQQYKTTGNSWTASLIVQLWTISRTMWEHRNAIRHSPDHARQQTTKQALLEEVEAQLDLGGNTLLPNDQYLIRQPLNIFRG